MTKIIGLTGRSGAGKGVVCEILAKHGIPAVDTDTVYHHILAQKGPCTEELVQHFGQQILGENGLVERKKLAACVFGKENTQALLHTLNEITHKYIMAKTHEIVLAHAKNGAPAVLIDAPLLFEAGVQKDCDLVLGILAPRTVCAERITERDSISEDSAYLRLGAQHDNDFFRANCDVIIENSSDLQSLERAICQFLKEHGIT
jgi:dephospho-CoA kinase